MRVFGDTLFASGAVALVVAVARVTMKRTAIRPNPETNTDEIGGATVGVAR
jgi:hypothetical protein